MTVQSAQWTDGSRSTILAEIDHVTGIFVPNDPSNPHRQQIEKWRLAGNTIADPLPPTQAELDEIARRADLDVDPGKVDILQRLRTANSAQISTWIDNNVTTLPQARTALKAIVIYLASRGA